MSDPTEGKERSLKVHLTGNGGCFDHVFSGMPELNEKYEGEMDGSPITFRVLRTDLQGGNCTAVLVAS